MQLFQRFDDHRLILGIRYSKPYLATFKDLKSRFVRLDQVVGHRWDVEFRLQVVQVGREKLTPHLLDVCEHVLVKAPEIHTDRGVFRDLKNFAFSSANDLVSVSRDRSPLDHADQLAFGIRLADTSADGSVFRKNIVDRVTHHGVEIKTNFRRKKLS